MSIQNGLYDDFAVKFFLRVRADILMIFFVQVAYACGWVNTNISRYLFCHR